MCFSVKVETNLKKISKEFNAKINEQAFQFYNELHKSNPKKYNYATKEENRIFAKYWAPIICNVRGVKEIRPMRYQLLPYFCTEEKYTRLNPKTGRQQEIKNTFNARLDSLTKAKAWHRPFGKFHAILPLKRFYEWVEKHGQKKLISFYPKEEYHLAPCLFDTWYSKDKKKIIQSFAIITTDPAPEILKMGHDRTPVNLKLENIDQWLTPHKSNHADLISLLNDQNKIHYDYNWEN